MLVLRRRKDEAVHIGDDVDVVVLGVKGGTVRLGISAPAGIRVLRSEHRSDGPATEENGPAPPARPS